MKLKSTGLSIGLMCLSTLFFAFPSFGLECSNLSGDWKGSCETDGFSFPYAVQIKQLECLSFEVFVQEQSNRELLIVDGSTIIKHAFPDGTGETITIEPKWNTDKTALIVNTKRDSILSALEGGTRTLHSMFSSVYSLEDGELRLSMTQGAKVFSCKLQDQTI
jgi:hypothetical protein